MTAVLVMKGVGDRLTAEGAFREARLVGNEGVRIAQKRNET